MTWDIFSTVPDQESLTAVSRLTTDWCLEVPPSTPLPLSFRYTLVSSLKVRLHVVPHEPYVGMKIDLTKYKIFFKHFCRNNTDRLKNYCTESVDRLSVIFQSLVYLFFYQTLTFGQMRLIPDTCWTFSEDRVSTAMWIFLSSHTVE